MKTSAPAPSGITWHILSVFQIKWLAILSCLLLIAWVVFLNFSDQWVQLEPENCSSTRLLRSVEALVPTSIEFVNKTREVLNVYWIDYNGELQPQGKISPGSTFYANTFLTHPFVVAHSDGSCIGVYEPAQKRGRAIVF